MQGKVEICGVNTTKLRTLTPNEMDTLLRLAKAGDKKAREKLIEGNLRLVLSVIQKFTGRGENADGVALPRLQNRAVDYLALGHIHQPTMQAERLDGRGRYRYSGCLEGRGYDECGKRGCFLLEIQNGRVTSETFMSFAKREVCERIADISVCSDYYEMERVVKSALDGVRVDDMVKVVLRGKHKAGLRKDLTLLSSRLCSIYFHAKVVDETQIYVDYSAYQNDLSERGEFVREVGRCALSEEERAEILDVGLKALAGEDVDL